MKKAIYRGLTKGLEKKGYVSGFIIFKARKGVFWRSGKG